MSYKEKNDEISSGHKGKAGEYLVASELLFRGFDASIMSVDVGVDLVAIKNVQTFLFQVKTATDKGKNRYLYDIRVSSFERHNNNQTFYIFVLKGEDSNFLILPYNILKKFIVQEIVKPNAQARYRITLIFIENQLYITNQKNLITYYLNNWDVIC